MPGPWEKYQQTDGPWAKYQSGDYQPSMLESAAGMAEGFQKNVLAPVMGVAGRANEIAFPGSELGGKVLGAVGQGFEKAGEFVAERGAQAGVPTMAAASAGMAVANIPNLIPIPGGSMAIKGRVLAPTVGKGREAAVNAAGRIGAPLTRGEITGNRALQAAENFTEKTILGQRPFEELRALGDAAMTKERTSMVPKGTPKDPWAVGYQSQKSATQREAAMRGAKNQKYEEFPTSVSIPTSKTEQVASDILSRQGEYLSTTRNSDVLAIAKDIQDNLSFRPKNTGKGDFKGITPSPGEYKVKYSAGPGSDPITKPNYERLKRLRETVGGKETEAYDAGRMSEARDFGLLKKAIDEDIDAFVSGQSQPMQSLVAQEFATGYQKANAFSRAFEKTFGKDAPEFGMIRDAKPEKIFDAVFQKNNESAIKKFRAIVGEDAFQAAKNKWLSDILESKNVANDLGKIEEGTLRSVLSGPELQRLRDYGAVQGIRKDVGAVQGTAGSARSNVQAGQLTGLGAGLLGLFTGNIPTAAIGIGQYLAPRPLARFLTSDTYRHGLDASVRGSLAEGAARTAIYSAFIDKITTKEPNQ